MTFQFSQWGGSFVVEMARGRVSSEDQEVEKLTAVNISRGERWRLGAVPPRLDHSFEFPDTRIGDANLPSAKAQAHVVLELSRLLDEQAEPFWQRKFNPWEELGKNESA